MKQTSQQHWSQCMKRIIVASIVIVVVVAVVAASRYGWLMPLTPPEEIGEQSAPVVAHRLGEISLVEFFPFGGSLSGFALMRTRDLRVDPSTRGSRLDGDILVVGDSRPMAFPTIPALVLGGLIVLITSLYALRRARVAQIRRQAA